MGLYRVHDRIGSIYLRGCDAGCARGAFVHQQRVRLMGCLVFRMLYVKYREFVGA